MKINIRNNSQTAATIEIEGEIGVPEQWQFANESDRVATYDAFRERLNTIVTQGVTNLRIEIRSGGGSVNDAMLIYGALCEVSGKIIVETHCYGYTASAATIIAQAASEGKRFITSNSLYLIHNSSTSIDGNTNQAQAAAALLAKTDQQIAGIYATRSQLEASHFLEIMARENGNGMWLSPTEVVEAGLADAIEEVSPIKNYINQLNKKQMTLTMKQKALSILNALFGAVKDIELTTAAGEALTVEREDGDPQVGDVASPDGEHLMPDGSTIVVSAGVISEIIAATEEPAPSEELTTAHAQLATANARIAELEAQLPKDEQTKILSAVEAMGGAKSLAAICSAYKPAPRESAHAAQTPRPANYQQKLATLKDKRHNG